MAARLAGIVISVAWVSWLYSVSSGHALETNGRVVREVLQRDCRPVKYVPGRWCTFYRIKTVLMKTGGSWWSSTKYYNVTKKESYMDCCIGYGGSNSTCKPLCHQDSNPWSCNRHEGRVIHKDGVKTSCSGGICVLPNTCQDCNTGYYADNIDGFCRACKPIPNCNILRCSDGSSSTCAWCDGELIYKHPGMYAFTSHLNSSQCLQACSWRPGTRCYPGSCGGDMLYPDNCTCAPGFSGSDCATFTYLPEHPALHINDPEVVFSSDKKLIVPATGLPDRKVWTSQTNWESISLNVPFTFDVPEISNITRTLQTYIDLNTTRIGISNVSVDSVLTRGNSSRSWRNELDCMYNATCALRRHDVYIRSTMWDDILHGGYPAPFRHRDRIEVTISLTNGGVVNYNDRETNVTGSYSISGATLTRVLEMEFDLYPPSHCMEKIPQCDVNPLTIRDFTTKSNIEVTWDGWHDEDSGIRLYRCEVYLLKVQDQKTGILYPDTSVAFQIEINATETSGMLKVTQPGAYFVEMSTVDWADNEKSTRGIFMFDDGSVVSLKGDPSFVSTADPATNFTWINKDFDHIQVRWYNRFTNERHMVNGWLNEVAPVHSVPRDLDDTTGKSNRTTQAISNIQGIVEFTVGYTVTYGLNNTVKTIDAEVVPKDMFAKQTTFVYEEQTDGNRLTFSIRGYDVMGMYAEDITTVTIDLSPPVVENLWLTKGDTVNITVHSEEELNKLTIEWEAYDIHSGLHTISWRIFDNFTGTDMVHGAAHEPSQGESQTLEDCEARYSSHLRGARCYCTPFDGCYNKYFQLKPAVTITGTNGLMAGLDKDVHESDYFIEVRVVNNALLETVVAKKITVDTSPPHPGSVYDGFPGRPEVDFQQSRDLYSHWDGFFDKESGVWFYMYGYGSRCLSSSEFDGKHSTDHSSHGLERTDSPTAQFTAPNPGTYYVTVVAFNRALDPSPPVCSDGVTVDDSDVSVTDVVVQGAVTRAGLVRNIAGHVWLIRADRSRVEVEKPSPICLNQSLLLSDAEISVLPSALDINGTVLHVFANICRRFPPAHSRTMSFVTSDDHLIISWNVSTLAVSIHDFEVGLSSGNSTPDRMQFVSSRQHQHIRLAKPNIWDGEVFYIVIRTITKAAVMKDTFIGPFIVDTTPPDYQGRINVGLEQCTHSPHLVATWQHDAFIDHGDPAPLEYQVAIGSMKFGHDVLPFGRLSPGCSCLAAVTCTAINIDRLDWRLHEHESYYVTVKAMNAVGMFTLASSDVYVHNVELPTPGVVFDVDEDNKYLFQDIVDIDFQSHTDQISARWSGFHHPHENVTFYVCICRVNDTNTFATYDVIQCTEVGSDTRYIFRQVVLEPFKTYFQTVTAITEAGNVTSSSDGVTVVVEDISLTGITVKEGVGCETITDNNLINRSHHIQETRLPCQDDLDYQASSNEIYARWAVPTDLIKITPDVYWALEERAPVADIWTLHRSFEHLKTSHHLHVADLALMAGRRYRVVLKFCAAQYCFSPIYSNGMTVLGRPPKPRRLHVTLDNSTQQIQVEVGPFFDQDIEKPDEARAVMASYEWAITDNSPTGKLITRWQPLNLTGTETSDTIQFSIPVVNISSVKCWKVSVRGYNKAGLSSVVSSDIRNCSDANQFRAHSVIDVVGRAIETKDTSSRSHMGQAIFLPKNSEWSKPDQDYTPFTNILSAVWPTLRYPMYTWAVLEVQQEDTALFYQTSQIALPDPCSHADSIHCGQTNQNFMNAEFSDRNLVHGKRYVVCIHANASVLHYEKWNLTLDPFHACSDGITVDLTPPTPGAVWLGQHMTDKYQTSSSCLTVNWQSFIDVEEEGQSAHISGVMTYQVAIGSSQGGIDIVDLTDVGLTNHQMFHGLQLQNGHAYFATVKATDFTGQTSEQVSRPIVVDISPPITTGRPITLTSRYFTDTEAVAACWTGVFSDAESGLSHYTWAVGSQRGYDDVMAYTQTTEECAVSNQSTPLTLLEGHAYFVAVKAHNHAGHYTIAVSWAFTVDTSPPVAGHVYDGHRLSDGQLQDVDFVTNMSEIAAHWSEYFEVHGAVKEYTVSVGSCNGCDDILSSQPVGIVYDVVLKDLILSDGQTYYFTVSACNTVDLCSTSTSDGFLLDSSPPVPGRVMDGLSGMDVQFQASRLNLGAKWFGFTDAQSGISHYVWRAGTTPGSDDILPSKEVHKLQQAFIIDIETATGQQLPVGIRIYVTVRAYNRAGMYSEATSNGFMVDSTEPVFVHHITGPRIGSVKPNTSVLPHIIRVEWEVWDNESFIDEQYLSIESHLGGDFNASSIKVAGLVRDYTFSNLDLHDGSLYCVTLVSCNGARICTEIRLQHLLVDSSPPTPGMFAINTAHSDQPEREPKDWMTWTVPYIRLAWLGFQDVHSGIDRYMINIGSTYMSNDLHKGSPEPYVVTHTEQGNRTQEGVIQTLQIWTKSLNSYKTVFISIWAMNGVGLPSPIVHHEFELAFGGSLELVRRCSALTCLGHCVCAPHGKLCHSDNICHDVTKNNSNYILSLRKFTDLTFPADGPDISHTPANTLSAAQWSFQTLHGKEPLWFEWSVGESQYDGPKGVFDESRERVWHDAGRNMSWIYSHPPGHYLREKRIYSFFTRAWYDNITFAVFRSTGVMVYTTPPQTVAVQARQVKETTLRDKKDVDYIDGDTMFSIDWTGKFTNDKCLTHFNLYISTSPGGNNLLLTKENIPSSVTSFNVTSYRFESNTVYYSAVQAYNMAGYHVMECSDGFKIDRQKPLVGVVQDGEGFTSINAINSSNVIPSFWYGFWDADSGIRAYTVCVSMGDGPSCQINYVHNVGLETRARLLSELTVPDGTKLFSEVQAIDFVGHSSTVVRSKGMIIDTSPPRRSADYTYNANVLRNPSFESSDFDSTLYDIQHITRCDHGQLHHWQVTTDQSCVLAVTVGANHSLPDGHRMAVVTGAIQQDVSNLTVGSTYRLTFYSSHLPMPRSMMASCTGFVKLDKEQHVFMLYGKPRLSPDQQGTSFNLSWHQHIYYFQAKAPDIILTIGTTGMTNHLAIDDVRLEKRSASTSPREADIKGHVQARTVFVHDWSSLHAEWNFVEEHSSIVEYLWAVGTVEGGTQLQPFSGVGKRTFAFTSSLQLVHDTTVYVTVVAVNAASLRTVSYSDAILIDLTPPRFQWINDGLIPGEDVDYQRDGPVSASWSVEDPESRLNSCEWALYTGNGDTILKDFEKVDKDAMNFTTYVQKNQLVNGMVFFAVMCTNMAGLTSTSRSDGVKIVTSAPSTNNVVLEIIGSTPTQYPVQDGYHGDASFICFRCSGFEDDDGINSFLVSLDGEGYHVDETITGHTAGFTQACFSKLILTDGNYSISVTAINQFEMFSRRVTAQFILLTTHPQITGEALLTKWSKDSRELLVVWSDVFIKSGVSLYYEVTLSWAGGGDGDIIQWQETKDTRLLVTLSLDDIPQAGINLRVSVRAINPAGLFTTAMAELFIGGEST